MNVIFGTKKLGKQDGAAGAYAKYPEQAVVTLEGDRGAGKSRRMFFNAKAAELLGLEAGHVQSIVFGAVEADEATNRIVLLGNASGMSNLEDITIYKTSKNLVPTETEPKEKMKSIQSSAITREINDFLELNEMESHEYALEVFEVDEMNTEVFKLAKIKSFDNDLDTNDDTVRVESLDTTELAKEEENNNCTEDCDNCDCDEGSDVKKHDEFITSLSSKKPEGLVEMEQEQFTTQEEAVN